MKSFGIKGVNLVMISGFVYVDVSHQMSRLQMNKPY